MKKFINNVEDVEKEMVEGFAKAYPNYVRKLECGNVLVRSDKASDKVALISGGGSGHEPAHAGYIGKGMLDGVACGAIFTSPTPDQIYEGIKAIDDGKGVLMIVKNYSGDIMNFDMAKELAQMEGIEVDEVVVNDDVAVENSSFTVGRRGVAGTVFVHKIAGAAALRGLSLAEVKEKALKAIANVRTMGVASLPCTVPAAGVPGFEINDDEIEMGIGIHGEPGVRKEKMKKVDEITDELLENILKDIDYSNSEVAVLLNSSGATPLMELYVIYNHLVEVLKEKGISVYKAYIGPYMTSMEMAGYSISLLKLDDELKELLDEEADTVAFKG